MTGEGNALYPKQTKAQRKIKYSIRFYWGLALFIGGCATILAALVLQKIVK